MIVFLLDVWHDLRAKRLWPAAVGLVGAILLSPLVLLFGPDQEKASSDARRVPAPQARAVGKVTLVDEKTAEESGLTVFGSKDPFKALAETPPGGSGAGSSSPGAREPRPSAGTGSAGESPFPPSAGAGGGGADPIAPQPSSETPSPRGDGRRGDTAPDERVYTFRVDLRFGQVGQERTMRALPWLSPLPDDRPPAVIFLGTTESAKSAGFLVTPGALQDGEGECSPTPEQCTVVYLRLDPDRDTHTITTPDGAIYRLRLLDIERVRWRPPDSSEQPDDRAVEVQANGGRTAVRDPRHPRRTPFIQKQRERRRR